MLDHFQTRAQKVVLLACASAFALTLCVTVASAFIHSRHPSTGFLVWDNLVVPALSTQGGGAAAVHIPFRSVLVSVDGRTIRSRDELDALLRDLPRGTPVTYVFQRGSLRATATVPTTIEGWREVLPVYLPYLLNGVVFFATGLIVFYFKPQLASARAGLAIGAVLGATLLLAIDTLSSAWLQRLYFMLEALIPGALLHFALCFPEEKAVARRHPALRWLVYLPFVGLGILQNIFLSSAPERHLTVNDWIYTSIAAAGLLSVVSLLHTYTTSDNALSRQRAKVVAAGVCLAAFVPSLGLLSITLVGLDIPMNLLSPFFLIYPLSIGYAIARHDLFEVDRFLRLGVVYAALSVLVFAGYAAIVLGFDLWLGRREPLPAGVVPLYLVVMLALLQPLRTRVQDVVDRIFHRQAYSYRAAVEATSRTLASILERDQIAAALLATLTDTMAIEWAALVVLGNDNRVRSIYTRPDDRQPPLASLLTDHELLSEILARGKLLTKYDLSDVADRQTGALRYEVLERAGIVMLLPARFERAAVAVVVLGEKKSGALYAVEDLELIQTLANQAALALTNSRAYEIIRETQDELVRRERLAAVGELCAAVAHGIRNPLAGIRAAAEMAREDADDPALVADGLEDVVREADRLETRVRALLDMSRPFEAKPIRGDLNPVVERTADAVRRRAPAGISFSVELDPTLPVVDFDSAQMSETIECLLVNAVEAIGNSGTIRVRTTCNGADAISLVISDTGPGIEPERLNRIFDLFYTSKRTGTGVGLATVKRLVEAHGGRVHVDSVVGRGTTFTLWLPRNGRGSVPTSASITHSE